MKIHRVVKKKEVIYNDPKMGEYKRNEVFNFEFIIKATPEILNFILAKSCTSEDIEQMKKDPNIKFQICVM